jgi:ABC-type multidrug transport system ATPase subunit/GNAT superfamily N-acetyltransferase
MGSYLFEKEQMNQQSLQLDPHLISKDRKIAEAQVLSTNWGKGEDIGKTIQLQYKNGSNSKVNFRVPRSACVTEGDIVFSYMPLDNNSSMEKDYLFLRCKNGIVQISPIYSVKTKIQIGELTLPIRIKEISQKDEFDGYISLSQYHYRNKILFGRHSPLVAVTNHPLLPRVVGYIDLTTAFFVNTPRRKILDEPTRLDGVCWDRWSKDAIKDHIPLFVRIARCVVHPELRSSGIGQILITHAASFANTHWQSAHCKPYFLEISADMLRYIPFAAKAGMVYVGETEGNLKRIAKDLSYLSANESRFQREIFKGELFGILDTKFSQLAKATAAICGSGEESIGDFIRAQIDHPTLDGWAQLAGVLSHPKPHYMMGLNKEAVELIAQRTKSKKIESPTLDGRIYIDQIYQTRLQELIKIQNVSVEIRFTVKRTEITHHIERAFEISLDDLIQPVLKNLSIEFQPGEIIVLTGLSGTGKTTLLHMLASELLPTTGSIIFPENVISGRLNSISSSKPLIEVIGKQDSGRGIYWLGVVGLSEPFLYVKPFSALSAGQKYRAMLARLLIRGANLWLIDEFCENLDLINTNLLARKLSSLARKVGATVVVASSDAGRFVKSLHPDRILILKGATDTNSYKILTGDKYIDQIKI